MLKICCVNGCQEIGKEKLSKIEGKVTVKPEFINTYPRDWLLCEKHFVEKAEKLDCCIEKCSNTASINELPEDMFGKVKIRSNCSHHLICLNHYKRFLNKPKVPNLPPIKREPVEPTIDQLPVEKKKLKLKEENGDDSATAEDNNEPKIKSETLSEKEMEIIEKCDVNGCNNEKIGVHFLHCNPIKLCFKHLNQFKLALRKAIIFKQICLPKECIDLIPNDPNHPLFNYPILTHDQVCSVCFNEPRCQFKCSKCPTIYCTDCFKMVNQNLNYPEHWVCSNCQSNFDRNTLFKEQLQLLLPIIEKSMAKASSEEFTQIIANEQKEIETKKQQLIEKKNKIQSLNVWLVCILPQAMRIHQTIVPLVDRKKPSDTIRRENVFVMSKAARQYMMLPHFSSITTAQFIGMVETIFHFIIDNEERIQFKLVSSDISLDTVALAHSQQYVDILVQIITNQQEWIPNIQLKRLMKKNVQFTYSMLLMKLSLQTTEAVCDGVRIIRQVDHIRNAIVFCGANGGMIGYDGCLSYTGESDNSIGSSFNGVGDFDDEHSKGSSNEQHGNPLGFPSGIKANQPSKMIYQTLLINYLAVALKFASNGGETKIGLLVIGKEQDENGTMEIIKSDIENKRINLLGCNDYRNLSDWNSTFENIKKEAPSILFVSIHTEEYNNKDDLSLFKTFACDLNNLSLIKNGDSYQTKIVHLIDSGFIQECNLDVYKKLTSSYISSLTE